MIRSAAVLAIALTFACSAAYGQEEVTSTPFDLTFGPNDDGYFGAVLKGNRFYSLSRFNPEKWDQDRTILLSPFVGIEVDGGWSSAPDALNNASISLKPALGISHIGRRTDPASDSLGTVPTTSGPWLHIYGDAKQRFGKFAASEGEDPEDVNQTMLGVGAQLRWAGFAKAYANLLASAGLATGRDDEAPSLSLTYYTVQRTNTELPDLPAGITADAFQSSLDAEVTLPLFCSSRVNDASPATDDPFEKERGSIISCPFGFTGQVVGTWPTGADVNPGVLLDLGLYLNTGSNIKPILRYRAGEEHGLEYDRQLLLGILWNLSQ